MNWKMLSKKKCVCVSKTVVVAIITYDTMCHTLNNVIHFCLTKKKNFNCCQSKNRQIAFVKKFDLYEKLLYLELTLLLF